MCCSAALVEGWSSIFRDSVAFPKIDEMDGDEERAPLDLAPVGLTERKLRDVVVLASRGGALVTQLFEVFLQPAVAFKRCPEDDEEWRERERAARPGSSTVQGSDARPALSRDSP